MENQLKTMTEEQLLGKINACKTMQDIIEIKKVAEYELTESLPETSERIMKVIFYTQHLITAQPDLNNPLLTAALQEIKRLQGIIEQAQFILDCTTSDTTFQEEGGTPYHPTFNQLNDHKVDMLSNILFQ